MVANPQNSVALNQAHITNALCTFATGIMQFICPQFFRYRRWLQATTYVFTFFTITLQFLSATEQDSPYRPCGDRTETVQSSCNLQDLHTKIARCLCNVLAGSL